MSEMIVPCARLATLTLIHLPRSFELASAVIIRERFATVNEIGFRPPDRKKEKWLAMSVIAKAYARDHCPLLVEAIRS